MALKADNSAGPHTSQPSKDDSSLSSDSSSGGIGIGSTEQEDQSSAVPTGIIYDYLSPEVLCGRAEQLLVDLLPGIESSEDFQVEYIGMGSYHKVVGFKVPMPKAATDDTDKPLFEGGEYVIRIEREDRTNQVNMERDVAILNGLAGKIDVPIPRVLMFDLGKTNPLNAAYTIATRLPGITLETFAEDEWLTTEQYCCIVENVTSIVERLASITAPYPGLITSSHSDGIDQSICPSGIPMVMFDLPFDTLPLTTLANPTPLTFMLALVDLWTTYEAADLPSEDGNFASWMKIKAIIHALSHHDILGSTFHLVHGDLAPRNILGHVVDDSTINITGVVDWDFASFAPPFCAYRAPLCMWTGGEDDANEWCEPEVLDAFKAVASPVYLKYVFSEEAAIARKVWAVLREGMVGEYRRTFAKMVFQDWDEFLLKGRVVDATS